MSQIVATSRMKISLSRVAIVLTVFSAVTASYAYDCSAQQGQNADQAQEVTPGDGYSLLGAIQPRHARDIQASNWSIGAETMDRDFTIYANWREYLGPLGVKRARIQSGWAKTEKTPGEYRWQWLDEIILDMVDQGVEPWVCLCYGNPVYPDGGGTGLGGGLPQSEEALQAWERYVKAMVARYKQHVNEWEVWNEPGLRGANAAENYARFLVRTGEAIRSQQRDACIIAFGMAGIKTDWVKQVLGIVDSEGKLDLIDQITYHPYKYNPDESYAAVEGLRKLVVGFSERIVIRQGENGAPSQRGSFGALADNDWTESSQAKWALRRLLGDLGHDIPSSYFAICDMQYPSRRNYKGLLAINDDRTVARAKLGYRAVQHLAAIFDNRLTRIRDFGGRVTGKEKGYSLFAYRNNVGLPVITVWRSSDTPGKRTELEQVTVTLPDVKLEQPVWIDLLTGNAYAMADSRWSVEGTATTVRVPVYDAPIVIAERAAVSQGLEEVVARQEPDLDPSAQAAVREIEEFLKKHGGLAKCPDLVAEDGGAKVSASDPIAALVQRLNATKGMWANGIVPVITLPQQAKPDDVLAQAIKMHGFPEGRIKTYRIREIRQVHLNGVGMETYSAALVDSDVGAKILLFSFFADNQWWTRFYDVPRDKPTKSRR